MGGSTVYLSLWVGEKNSKIRIVSGQLFCNRTGFFIIVLNIITIILVNHAEYRLILAGSAIGQYYGQFSQNNIYIVK